MNTAYLYLKRLQMSLYFVSNMAVASEQQSLSLSLSLHDETQSVAA